MPDHMNGRRKTKPKTRTLATTVWHNIRDTHATDFQDCVCSRWKTSIGNCNDKCSTDRFPNASCLKKPDENKIHYTPFSQSKLHSNIGTAGLFYCFRSFVFHGALAPSSVRTSSHRDFPECNSHSGLTEGGKLHSCGQQQEGFREEGLNQICGPR